LIDPVDTAKEIRPGEELDLQKLSAYLKDNMPGYAQPLEVLQFPGGHSNLTYLLKIGGHEFVLRRPPFGKKIKSAHDMGREYHILSKLIHAYPHVPRPRLYCEDEAVIGAPFYIMERIKGTILRAKPPAGVDLSPQVMKTLSENFIDNLAAIHAVDIHTVGLEDFGKPEGYVARQINGWTGRYRSAQTDELPQIDEVISWLADHMPAEQGASLIHNDYKYDNLVLDPADPTQIIGVLDWEMATIGDPLMDLGTALSYWVNADDPEMLRANAFGLTTLPGSLTRSQLAERYSQVSGRELPDLLFYYTYGLFKLAVIAQQIYARFQAGDSQDERFARFIDLVRLMGQVAAHAAALGKIG